jgi:hypothetical protein
MLVALYWLQLNGSPRQSMPRLTKTSLGKIGSSCRITFNGVMKGCVRARRCEHGRQFMWRPDPKADPRVVTSTIMLSKITPTTHWPRSKHSTKQSTGRRRMDILRMSPVFAISTIRKKRIIGVQCRACGLPCSTLNAVLAGLFRPHRNSRCDCRSAF